MFDPPGTGDPELSIHGIIDDIKENVGHQVKFDAAILVIKNVDYRASPAEIIACKVMKGLLENSTAQHFFCCMTHCDLIAPNSEHI